MTSTHQDLIERLRKELPVIGERETVWCSVRGDDLRAAVDALASSPPPVPASLQQAAEAFARQVEALAFSMPPPNPYTPQFAQLAIGLRNALAATPSPPVQEPVPSETWKDGLRDEATGVLVWKQLFWDLALILKCLPSTFADANEHVFRKARELTATTARPPQAEPASGLSAADIIRAKIERVKSSNPGRKHGSVSSVGEFGVGLLCDVLEQIEALPSHPTGADHG